MGWYRWPVASYIVHAATVRASELLPTYTYIPTPNGCIYYIQGNDRTTVSQARVVLREVRNGEVKLFSRLLAETIVEFACFGWTGQFLQRRARGN